MCTDDQDFSTIVGPRSSVERLQEIFSKLLAYDRHDISEPRVVDLSAVHDAFYDPASPTVAVVYHPEGEGFRVTASIQAELLGGHAFHGIPPMPELFCEPGYEYGAAAPVLGPHVQLDATGLQRLDSTAKSMSLAGVAVGNRVAVLDTGCRNSPNQMVDFRAGAPSRGPSDDDNGHGTAVAEVITSINANADLYPLRVLGSNGKGRSYEVLAGVAYALWSGEFDVINASLTSATASPCEHALGTSIDYILRTAANAGRREPMIVAAAGNQNGKRSGYPAVLPGAVVAMALEGDAIDGYTPAAYNSAPPLNANTQEAFGGSPTDPVGTVTPTGGSPGPLYGTSFAAAGITGALVP